MKISPESIRGFSHLLFNLHQHTHTHTYKHKSCSSAITLRASGDIQLFCVLFCIPSTIRFAFKCFVLQLLYFILLCCVCFPLLLCFTLIIIFDSFFFSLFLATFHSATRLLTIVLAVVMICLMCFSSFVIFLYFQGFFFSFLERKF